MVYVISNSWLQGLKLETLIRQQFLSISLEPNLHAALSEQNLRRPIWDASCYEPLVGRPHALLLQFYVV